MAANQVEYSRLEQRFVMECLVAVRCKPCDIYGRICNSYGEACFSQKMFTNMLAITSLSEKEGPRSGKTQTLQ